MTNNYKSIVFSVLLERALNVYKDALLDWEQNIDHVIEAAELAVLETNKLRNITDTQEFIRQTDKAEELINKAAKLLTEVKAIESKELNCPSCGARHLDTGEWYNKPHKTHLCLECGRTWRPFDHNTRGV